MKSIECAKQELDNLINLGDKLQRAIYRDLHEKEYDNALTEAHGEAEAKKIIKSLPDFRKVYQSWYSESLVVIKQLIPDRIKDFSQLYEVGKNRKEINYENYVIADYLLGIQIFRGEEVVVDSRSAVQKFKQQVAILRAARKRFESSLFELRQIVQADLFDSEIEAAKELHKNKFTRAAGSVAGVVLEKHLLQVCKDHNISLGKKNPTISNINEALKSSSIITVPQWRHISMLADIRNLCSHSKDEEPSLEQVKDLIDGTEKVIKTIF